MALFGLAIPWTVAERMPLQIYSQSISRQRHQMTLWVFFLKEWFRHDNFCQFFGVSPKKRRSKVFLRLIRYGLEIDIWNTLFANKLNLEMWACVLQGALLSEVRAVTRRQASAVTSMCTDADCNFVISGDASKRNSDR